jgi:hypothetical protein
LAGRPKRIGTASPVTDGLRTSIKHLHVKGGDAGCQWRIAEVRKESKL